MKTNQVMIRHLSNFEVPQRTKDGFFNLTALVNQWNDVVESNMGNPMFKYKKKNVADFFRLDQTKEFISALIEEENLHTQNSAYVKSKGKNGGTWVHPYLFIKAAMWLNPRFEVKVVKFVHDEMIAYRNEAGDSYKELASAVSKLVGKDFMRVAMSKVARGINYCVFGNHETLIRNQYGDEKKMRELFSFQRKVADLINEGFIKDFDSTMKYLNMMFGRMHTPKILLAK